MASQTLIDAPAKSTSQKSAIGTSALKSNAALVRHYLLPQALSLIAATIAALLLGIVAALVSAAVGPALLGIKSTGDHLFTMSELLGPRLGVFAQRLTGIQALTASDLLKRLPLILISLAGIKAILSLAQWFTWERAGELVSKRARADLVGGYLGFDTARRKEDDAREREAELSSTITTDVRLLREYLVHFYGGLPREIAQIVFTGITLVLMSPKLFLIVVLGIVPAAGLASRLGKVIRRRAAKALQDYSSLTEWLQQRLLGIETIKHYKTEAIEAAKMEGLTTALYERFLRAARVKARTSPSMEALTTLCMVVVLIVALRDISAGTTTGAVQMGFFTNLAVLSQSAANLGRYLNSNREGAAAVDRIRRMMVFLSGSQQKNAGYENSANFDATTAESQNQIACRGLTASYPGQEVAALREFSYVFKAGRIYCICGPSGAGKSTLLNLLLGLIPAKSGSLEMSCQGQDRKDPICYMPQKVLLVPDTVAANVAYPDTDIDSLRVEEALQRVGLDEAINSLPLKIQALLGEGGAGLSGGQAQRVMLARLHYHRRPFVLVDEGTSALDPEIEGVVYDLLRELAQRGAVVITIAHRLAGALAADDVILLNHGELAKHGSPTEVLRSPEYLSVLG